MSVGATSTSGSSEWGVYEVLVVRRELSHVSHGLYTFQLSFWPQYHVKARLEFGSILEISALNRFIVISGHYRSSLQMVSD